MKWPQLLQVGPGREFMGAVTKEMERHKTNIRRRCTEIYRHQAIVKRFNRTLAECLFRHQYWVEMRLPEGLRFTAWVKRLPEVVSALNNEVTRLMGKKPAEERKTRLLQNPLLFITDLSEWKEKIFHQCVHAVSLPARSGLWKSTTLKNLSPKQMNMYYLQDGPKRGFAREELLVVPPYSELPPENP